LWLRQTIWGHKREAYANIAKRCHALQASLIVLRSTRVVFQEQEKNAVPEQHVLSLRLAIAERMTEYADAHRQSLDALTEAEIFLDSVTRLRKEYLDNKWLGDVANAAIDPESGIKVLLLLGKWATKVVALAKEDLGVNASK
jgi:hypothetical protein